MLLLAIGAAVFLAVRAVTGLSGRSYCGVSPGVLHHLLRLRAVAHDVGGELLRRVERRHQAARGEMLGGELRLADDRA